MLVALIPVAIVFGCVLVWAVGGIYVAYGEPAHYFGPSCIGFDDDYWFDLLLAVAMLVFAAGALMSFVLAIMWRRSRWAGLLVLVGLALVGDAWLTLNYLGLLDWVRYCD